MANNLWHNVFVYGTLQSRAQTIRSLSESSHSEFVACCETSQNYKMYDLGHFPGVTMCDQSLGNVIAGELWCVSDSMMDQLDVIEGYPDFYNRKIIDTTAGRAWMYYLPETHLGYATQISQQQGVVSWLDQSSRLEPA